MRRKKIVSPYRRICRRVIALFLSILIMVVVFYEVTIRDRIELAIKAQIKNISNTCINEAIGDYLKSNKEICTDLNQYTFGDDGAVKSIVEDGYYVNIMKTGIIECTQTRINDVMCNHGIDVKLGNFTGLNFFSDMGPCIHLDVDATSNVTCEIVQQFEAAGLNQTLHCTMLELYVDVYVGNPIRIESVEFKTYYELSRTLIVGDIPSAYGSISRY